jgi:hypothetical protein
MYGRNLRVLCLEEESNVGLTPNPLKQSKQEENRRTDIRKHQG